MGSALPDPVKDQAALAPIPQQALENKPAPGQTGPKGMSPRTTYSRVNTGVPPTMDAGAMGQKSSPNRGMEFLPAKIAAQRGFTMTTMHERPSLQAMVKAAMAGTTQQLSVNLEASRQASTRGGTTKTASANADPKHVSTEMIGKLANALGFIEQELRKEAELAPGEGPGALQVLEATSSETNIDAGESGQATAQNQPPKTPATQPEQVQSGSAGTGLETNDDMQHPEQPVEPIKNASGLAASNMLRLQKMAMPLLPAAGLKGLPGRAKTQVGQVAQKVVGKGKELAGKATNFAKEHKQGLGTAALGATAGGAGFAAGKLHSFAKDKEKKGSAPITLLRKMAEDAINPAQISSSASVNPAEPPPGASASQEGVPAEPADVTSQKRLISSNEAAINYTKGQAKADPKKDVNQVLQEPALTSSTDKVLQQAFDNTGAAGVKISSAGSLRKTAMQVGSQRVLLDRLLKQANTDCAKDAGGKDKKSMGMAPTTPQAATGASAATMGQ